MGEPISPVIQGLTSAMSLADMLHRQRIENQQIALSKQRIQDEEQGRQYLQNQTDLKTRLQLHDAGAREATPDDLAESNLGFRMQSGPAQDANAPEGGMDGQPQLTRVPSDLKGRMVNGPGGKQYVLPSEEEDAARSDRAAKQQTQQQVDKADALSKVGKIKLQISPEDQKTNNLPAEVLLDAAHLAPFITATGQERLTDTPATAQEQGYPKKVPFKNLGSVVSSVNAALGVKSREGIADKNRTAANDRADKAQTGLNTRAGERNATTIEAAGIRRDTPTAGQSAVESRFEQRRQDQAQKQFDAIQAKEDQLHTERTLAGEKLKSGTLSAKDAAIVQSDLKAKTFQIQAYQSRKAKLAGAATPPKAIQDKIPEGQQATGPDGHMWMKKDGIVYFVQ